MLEIKHTFSDSIGLILTRSFWQKTRHHAIHFRQFEMKITCYLAISTRFSKILAQNHHWQLLQQILTLVQTSLSLTLLSFYPREIIKHTKKTRKTFLKRNKNTKTIGTKKQGNTPQNPQSRISWVKITCPHIIIK